MKNFILAIIIFFSISIVNAQVTFLKTIGGGIQDLSCYIEQTTDGGYFIAGTDYSSLSVPSGYVIKTNAIGDTLWTSIYGTNVTFHSGKQTTDGGYVLLGTMGNGSSSNIYVLKIDSLGAILWQKIIGGSSSEEGISIQQTSDGGYIIAGYGKSYGAGNDDVYIVKLDAGGNIQWDNVLGQTGLDQAYFVKETTDGKYIITGVSGASTLMMKLNSTGILQWSNVYSEGGFNYKGKNILQTADRGYMILGSRINTSPFSSDVSIIKTDSLGNINWSKVYLGSTANNDLSFKATTSGNFIIASSINNSSILFSLIDSLGNMIWNHFITGSADHGSYASETSDGGYVYTGYLQTTSVGGGIYFIKADNLGNNGCIDSTATITVNNISPITGTPTILSTSGITISTPSTFLSSIGRTITTTCISTGINEFQVEDQVAVYPNPSSDQFNFSGLEKGSKIEVFDITGQSICEIISSNDFQTINLINNAKGIYFYRITKETKILQQGKFILIE